jgi:hypothetical protein
MSGGLPTIEKAEPEHTNSIDPQHPLKVRHRIFQRWNLLLNARTSNRTLQRRTKPPPPGRNFRHSSLEVFFVGDVGFAVANSNTFLLRGLLQMSPILFGRGCKNV